LITPNRGYREETCIATGTTKEPTLLGHVFDAVSDFLCILIDFGSFEQQPSFPHQTYIASEEIGYTD